MYPRLPGKTVNWVGSLAFLCNMAVIISLDQTLKLPYAMSCILTHWGRVTHICVSKLTIIGSDNGLSPVRRQAIIWTNAGILLIRPLGTNFSEMWIEILILSFMKIRLKVPSAKWRPFCLGLYVLNFHITNWCNYCHLCGGTSLPPMNTNSVHMSWYQQL